MKTKTGKNKMKTLNKKNIKRINELLLYIRRDARLSSTLGKEGAAFWFAAACNYDCDFNIIKLYEEFGICAQPQEIIEDDIAKKSTLEEWRKNAWDRYFQLKEKEKKTA